MRTNENCTATRSSSNKTKMAMLVCWLSSWMIYLATVQPTPSFAQQATSMQEPTSAQTEQLLSVVLQFLANKERLGCNHDACKLLVTDFVLPDGRTSPFGIQSAEMLSVALSKENKSLIVLDRSLVQSFLQEERIPSRFVNQIGVARWLAKKLNADVVVTGELAKKRKKDIDLTTYFVSVKDEKQNPLKLAAKFHDDAVDLSPTDTLRTLPPIEDTINGERVYRAGVHGVGLPRCFHFPNPPYTEEAREAHFRGAVTVEALIDPDGKVKPLRVVYGGPGGLSEVTQKTMETWQCQPALLNGKPVPTVMPFEVNFSPN
jgi:hypothetical protein